MNRNVLELIKKHQMLSPGDHLVVALSGGRDSMALLHLMLSLREQLSVTVSAAHYNHNLRGEESLRDEAFVREYCREHEIPLAVGSGDVSGYAAEHGVGIEEAARLLRYDFLLSLEGKIATAHNADDNLETLLMHLIRGTGLHGLGGIPPVRDRLIRPLLTVERAAIDAYCLSNHIPYVEDSTNREDFCLRNRLRHQVLPLLRQENPGIAGDLSRLSLLLREEDAYLAQEAAKLMEACLREGGLSVAALLELPEIMQRRILRQFLSQVPELSESHIEAARNLLHSPSPSAKLSLPGGNTLCRVYDLLSLNLPTKQEVPSPALLSPGERVIWGRWEIALEKGICPEKLPPGTVALNIEGSVLLRTRLPGDRIRLPGGEKKLKSYLIDCKIPAYLRDSLPVAVFEETIVAVPPLTAAWPYGAKTGSDSLLLTVKELEDIK